MESQQNSSESDAESSEELASQSTGQTGSSLAEQVRQQLLGGQDEWEGRTAAAALLKQVEPVLVAEALRSLDWQTLAAMLAFIDHWPEAPQIFEALRIQDAALAREVLTDLIHNTSDSAQSAAALLMGVGAHGNSGLVATALQDLDRQTAAMMVAKSTSALRNTNFISDALAEVWRQDPDVAKEVITAVFATAPRIATYYLIYGMKTGLAVAVLQDLDQQSATELFMDIRSSNSRMAQQIIQELRTRDAAKAEQLAAGL